MTDICIAPDCTRSVRTGGYCRGHLAAVTEFGHPGGAAATHGADRPLKGITVTAAPILEAVTKAGGVKTLLADVDDQLTRRRLESVIRRALERGVIDADNADTIATDVLHANPREVWGRAWDAASTFLWADCNEDLDGLLGRIAS